MLYLLLLPALFAGSSLAARQVQRLNLNLYAVGGFVYLFAGLFYGACFLCRPQPLAPPVLAGGVLLGLVYAATYLVFVPTLADRGVSVMAAFCQLSALIPMAASLLIWHERPTPVRWAGAILCLIAMPMLALDHGITDTRLTWRKLATFAALVVLNGSVLVGLKWFEQLGVPQQINGFMLTTFGTAALLMAALWRWYAGTASGPVVGWGVLTSLAYIGPPLALVGALSLYEGVVVFPFSEAGALALTVAFAALVWREMPGRLGLAGTLIVTVAAVLINL